MTELQLTGNETLLSIAILAFVVLSIIFLFKIYFQKLSQSNLAKRHFDDDHSATLNSRVKYSEVNAFSWTRPIFLLSLATAISFTLFAFSWTSHESMVEADESYGPTILPLEIEIQRTQHPKSKPPPPPPPTVIDIPIDIIPEKNVELLDESIDVEEAIEEPIVNPVETGEGDGPPPPPQAPKPIIEDSEPEVLPIAEQMPRFPGCEDIIGTRKEKQACAEKKLLEYIYDNLDYPALAIDNGIQGKSVIRFTVDKKGNVTDIKVLLEPGGGCGKAAAKVVEKMNEMPVKWTPGKQRGRTVKVLYTLPIEFKLK